MECIHEYYKTGGSGCFSGCVDPDNCNPRAHGGITVHAKCTKCGDEIVLNVHDEDVEGIPEGYSVLGWAD